MAAIAAFTIWGVLPLYMKPLHELSALVLLPMRSLWSFWLVFSFGACFWKA